MTKHAAQMCYEAIIETEIDFVVRNCYSSDFKVPTKVRHLVPRQAKRGGSRPSITGAEVLGRVGVGSLQKDRVQLCGEETSVG